MSDPAEPLSAALAAAHSAIHSGESCSPRLHAEILDAMAQNVVASFARQSGPAPLDVERLAKALVASDLMRRYSEYAIDAHEWTMAREPIGALADEWAAIVAREYAALAPHPDAEP